MKRLFGFLIFLLFPDVQAGIFDWWSSIGSMRAEHAYSTGDVAGAQCMFEHLTVEQPCDVKSLCGLADCAYTQGRFAQAQTYYERLLACAPSDEFKEPLWFNIGCSQAQQKDFKSALASFERVVALNKNNTRAQKNIEILKKLLEQEKKKETGKKEKNKKDNQEKSNSEQAKKDAGQKDQQQQDADNNSNRERNKQQQGNQQQPNQARDEHGDQKPEKAPQQNQSTQNQQVSDQQRQQHESSSQQATPEQTPAQNTQKNSAKQLDKQSQALLHDINTLDQHGQHLYLRALAGQANEQKRGAHDW